MWSFGDTTVLKATGSTVLSLFMIGLTHAAHLATLDERLAAAAPGDSPARIFAGVSDDFWFWAMTDGYRSDARLARLLPAYPAEDIQYRFTGAAGDDTMREAFGFYQLVQRLVAEHGLRPTAAVLEFGCGWGRMIRLFLREIEPRNLWGIDCMPAAIDICTATNPYCQFRLTEPLPPCSLADDSFDLVYAYSVFSHLSEDAHARWLSEFRRILRPGGLLIATTRSREFILECAAARARHEARDWAQGTVFAFPDTAASLARYDRGEFMYEPIGGGDVLDKSFFGETCIPRGYVERKWTESFGLVGYLDDRRLCQQNVIVVRKP
jgi:SAM-dependent methyltransferase